MALNSIGVAPISFQLQMVLARNQFTADGAAARRITAQAVNFQEQQFNRNANGPALDRNLVNFTV